MSLISAAVMMKSHPFGRSLHACPMVVRCWAARNPLDQAVTSVSEVASTPSPRSDATASRLAICCASVSDRPGVFSRICCARSLAVWPNRVRHCLSPSFLDSHSSMKRPYYFPANSFFTISLTVFPSTRMPAAEKRAMAFFITVPISFIVGEPISAMTAFTPATISASLAALGR